MSVQFEAYKAGFNKFDNKVDFGEINSRLNGGYNSYTANNSKEYSTIVNNGPGSEKKQKVTPKPKGLTLEDLKKYPPNHLDYKAPKSGPRKVNHPRGNGWIDR